MSVLGKKWFIKNQTSGLSAYEKLLENRKDIELNAEAFHDPHLFGDMSKVVERIEKAMQNNERIMIFGDYDVDGITSTAILFSILNRLKANVSYRLPHRVNDGYGLSQKFIDEFRDKDVQLVITVDCGISCFQEVEKANEYGMEVIITDHHNIPEKIPNAYAILHPKHDPNYPFKELTGAGVALKLAHALIKHFFPQEEEELVAPLIDLASLGTVADLGPLTGENRYLVKRGLQSLNNTKWLGIKKILQAANFPSNNEITATTIGFLIAPRINAAGRIGDPYLALHLLLQQEANEKLHQLGDKLEALNKERQLMTEESIKEAEEFLLDQKEIPYIIVTENPNWHVGVLGLIASKLVEKYSRPAIVMQDLGDVLVASARSPEFFNVIEAISEFGDCLKGFGGHAQAAGFSLKKENLEDFKEKIGKYAEERLKNQDLKPLLEIDCQIEGSEVNFELLEKLETLAPFGVGNSRPTLLVRGVEPQFIEQIGRDSSHLKFTLDLGDSSFKAVAFRMGTYAEHLRKHNKIDLVFQIESNTWNNKTYLELRPLDFAPSQE